MIDVTRSTLPEPTVCPVCQSENIETSYGNRGNGNYVEWWFVECDDCDRAGRVESYK